MRIVILTLAAVALLGVGVYFIPHEAEQPESVPEVLAEFGNVANFEFLDQEGAPFSSEQLEGKVWLANFVFTSCSAECPILTAKMMHVREELGTDANVEYVSFSVDPVTDTPERLKEYASDYGSAEDWVLLTGDGEKLDSLIKNSFLLPTAKDYHERRDIAATGFIHSNKLIVVDQKGTVRYAVDGLEEGAVERLSTVMKRLM
ncbi:SCO family protein [Pelagicoccus albus]|uniref:SCO family protein n=1 Tax=Pelagicoccus albus TaxID=415222 RepID=A0A7X1E7R2_9BACT|nr:SCO family protein [Pelagicoccus albus]MBC2605466.1 SCO family protein [Pelagicoccus albus]